MLTANQLVRKTKKGS